MAEVVQKLQTQILLRNDVALNWSTVNPILGKGEVGLESDTNKFKVGDGLTAWNELGYFGGQSIYQDNITKPGTMVGDIAVVKTEIATGKYSHTAYVWDGKAWAAMDGNYNANNVYLDNDITLAGNYTQVGNITKGSTEAKTLSAKGKSIAEVLSTIFTQTLYPSKPTPSVSVSLTNAGSYEVGQTVTPSFKVTFDPKTYTYGSTTNTTDGSTTGSAPSGNATVTIVGGASSSLAVTMSGNTGTAEDASLVVVDGTSYYGSEVSLGYSDGYDPVNNLDQSAEVDTEGATTLNAAKVLASTATNGTDTSKITPFRYSFKYSGSDNTSAIADAWIHNTVRLNTNNMVKNAAIGDIAVAAGDKRVMFAVPGTSKTLKEVKDVDGMGLDIKEKFTSTTVQISGKNVGENLTTYTVWYFENPNGFSKTTMKVTFN